MFNERTRQFWRGRIEILQADAARFRGMGWTLYAELCEVSFRKYEELLERQKTLQEIDERAKAI